MYINDVPGLVTEGALQLIEAEVLHLPQNAVILEVGACLGRVTTCLAMTAPTATVYAVDIWRPILIGSNIKKGGIGFDALSDEDAEISLENFKRWVTAPNVKPVQTTVSDRFDGIPDGSADLIFIDGNHHPPFLSDDLWFYARKLKPTGVMMGSLKSGPGMIKREVSIFQQSVGGELSFIAHDLWRLTDISAEAILAKRYVVQGYKFKWYKEEHQQEQDSYIDDLRAEVEAFSVYRSPEAEFISKAIKASSSPVTYIDVGCWGGVLAEKVIAGGNIRASYLYDTSQSLTAIAAERNPNAYTKALTVVSRPDEAPIICAERGRSLYSTSPLKRYMQDVDLVRLKIGPTATAEDLIASWPKFEGPVFIKVDINCYEPMIVEELIKLDIDLIGLHVKVQTIRKQETLQALEKAAEKFKLVRPHGLLYAINNRAYATVSLTRINGWLDVRGHNSTSLATFTFVNS